MCMYMYLGIDEISWNRLRIDEISWNRRGIDEIQHVHACNMCVPLPSPPLSPAAPGVAVQELVVDAMVGGVRGLVNVSWSALPEEQWNGVPQGYYVSWGWVGLVESCDCHVI